jgi:hypothetical protein
LSNQQTTRDPTIYHYRLIRKVALRPENKYSAMVTAALLAIALYFVYGWMGVAYTLIALLVMLAVHAFVLRVTVRRVDELSEKKWAFRRDWPWIGPLPIMDTQLSLFRRLHYHLLLVGCCVTTLFYPWAPSSLVVALLYWHLWLLVPRLHLMLTLRKERGDGVIRLEPSEVCYYHQ